jgi:3-isopropylmalate/(R)-2-methylmalate dehydratase small subunit
VIRRGRVWKFGDSVDTDVMLPGKALRLSPREGSRYLFDAVRGENWAGQVRAGDLVVGGEHFGAGSARPVAIPLRLIGVGALLAESMPSLFQRNCVNAGLLALAVPGIAGLCDEGDELEIDTDAATVRNLTSDAVTGFAPMPQFVTEIVEAGGLVAQLERAGYFGGPAEGERRP